jgi:hypothetical protein
VIVVKMVVMRIPLHVYTKYNEYLKMSLETCKGGKSGVFLRRLVMV